MSRYNTEALCGPCQQAAASPADAAPAAIPALVWDLPEIREALDRLDMPALFTRLRARTGRTQAELAALAGRTQTDWSKTESGQRRLVNIDTITSILTRLGVPASHVRLPLPAQSGAASRRAVITRAAAESVDFVASLAPPSATDAILDEIEVELSRIATAYVHAPLWPLFTDLVRIRDQLFGLLRARQRHWHTRRLYLLTGVTCLLLAHASQNLGDEPAAHSQIKTAMICADEAGHDGLRAWGRGTSALIAEWSPQRHLALRLAADAYAYAPAGPGRVRIAAIEARTAARVGDAARATAALERMRAAQEHAEPDNGLTAFGGLLTFPAVKASYYAGGTYALLGDHQRALEHATAAIRQYETGLPEDRSYGDEALARLDVVTAHLGLGHVEEAARHLTVVLSLPAEQRISQLGSGLRRVLTALARPAVAGMPGAADLLDAARRAERALTGSAVPSVP
ncbi:MULTISPECIES: helix-turn-helix domain-containing protein [Streptomyces]|uniref:helix-turn-helix domain-containing protein n=1 Tax=Streptomyces TaxID=1883 RepID=UPI00224971AF|nr:helix-turn-helix transcriptional regulator [Streptomyces sp. JHD 1]MCX2968221.1 helix-turn-helix transcriptional regulator [Streptomyces sp. JHD 1]